MEIVRKKQMTIRRAIIATKMKLARVSKPSHLANASIGDGKMAMIMKTRGSKSQAMECLIDIRFLVRQMIMIINRMMAAIDISIWRLVMMFNPNL